MRRPNSAHAVGAGVYSLSAGKGMGDASPSANVLTEQEVAWCVEQPEVAVWRREPVMPARVERMECAGCGRSCPMNATGLCRRCRRRGQVTVAATCSRCGSRCVKREDGLCGRCRSRAKTKWPQCARCERRTRRVDEQGLCCTCRHILRIHKSKEQSS
ncbi:hypothetical protein Uis4E_2189 [Bifidobacterium parmae]|uniref:Uncharacterized protein n=1 Tax=Bifidobacterium parmae TaxID=361854 RepID=A0A2N5IVM0_9BIFI|nr:hypothetical protein Uis4E_2189 [Bifidobacterium parmae]